MSGTGKDENAFVVTPDSDGAAGAADHEAPNVGGTTLSASEQERMRQRHSANPDEPLAIVAPRRASTMSNQQFYSSPGRLAIVQGQVYIVGVIMVFQLWLITTALFEMLSGNIVVLWPMAIASFVGFLVALIVFFWPRRRTKGF